MDKRHERLLEETLQLPGNQTCADCHAPSPRWSSVNLGIFICVNCASIHRKLGTHKSRVKSVTLDTWTREQINHLSSTGNTASNSVYNPNESLNPPPTSRGADERDGEMEKYIRRKYESGAFKAGSGTLGIAPTSMNRAREREGREVKMENRRNPELNDVLVKKDARDRDLPALPSSAGAGGARPRPMRSGSSTGGLGGHANLVDLEGGSSSTLPLQVNAGTGGGYHQQTGPGGPGGGPNGMWPTQQTQQPTMGFPSYANINPQQTYQHAYSAPSTSTMNGLHNYQQQPQYQPPTLPQQQFGTSPSSFPNQSYIPPQQYGSYSNGSTSFLTPQNQYQQQTNPYGQSMGNGAYFPQQGPRWGMQMGTGMR